MEERKKERLTDGGAGSRSLVEQVGDKVAPKVKSKPKKGAITAIYIHASVYGCISLLLMGINFLSILFTKNRFPWSLYVVFIWGSLVLMHFALTWSILKGTDAGTEELDEMVRKLVDLVLWFVDNFSGLFMKGFNPFPQNSRLARLWDYLMLGVEPEDDF